MTDHNPSETKSAPNPCETDPGEFDHDFETVDDSFDHEYGTQQVIFKRCRVCGYERDLEGNDCE
jgi:hypothetical protein